MYRGEEYSRINRFDNGDQLYESPGLSGLFFSASPEDVYSYGIPHEFILSPRARLFEGDSSREYCEENNLLDEEDENLYKISDGRTLNEIIRLFEQRLLDDMNSILGAFQYMAKKYLSAKGFDGAHWEYEDDITPEQYQIWNVKLITYVGEYEN